MKKSNPILLLVTVPLALAAQSLHLAWPVDGGQPVETIDLGAQAEGDERGALLSGFARNAGTKIVLR